MCKSLYLAILCIVLIHPFARAQRNVLDIGVRLQQSVNLYNENGLALNYSAKHLKPDKLYFGFSYVTSRLGSALHSNAIKQDNYVVSAAWFFKKHHLVRPFTRLNTGYFSANYGDKIFDVLDQSSLLLAPELGLCFQTKTPLKILTSAGYNLFTGDGTKGPGTLYPLFYELTISWDVMQRKH